MSNNVLVFRSFIAFCIVMVVFAIAGCTSLQQGDASAKLAVTYGTLKTIEGGDDPLARAVEIATRARESKRLLDSESVSVALLAQTVRSRLPADLSAADRLLADALIDAVVAELQARVGSGVIAPEQKLAVNQVLDWIIDAAGAVGG